MKRTSIDSARFGKEQASETLFQSSVSRYLRAFAKARAMRFWCPGMLTKAIGATAFAASLTIGAASAQAQFPASFDLSTLDGTNGLAIEGGPVDLTGFSVSGAGDVNGDGFDDVIIGVGIDDFFRNYTGESYVVFGGSGGFSPSLNLGNLDGSNGFTINGVDLGDGAGLSVSGAGDVNGDGFADVIVGAPYAGPNANSSVGESYIVFGSNSGSSSIDLSSLDGNNGFVINGIDNGDFTGYSVSGVGDVNGDGIDDVIIGAAGADPNGNSRAGESYVVFGSINGFSPSLDLSNLDGTNGFLISGIDVNDSFGRSVSGAGDFNGDGIDDLIIGSNADDPIGNLFVGTSYVVFGQRSTAVPEPSGGILLGVSLLGWFTRRRRR